MASNITKEKAERIWNRYNTTADNVLTVDEVKACIKETFGCVDDDDVKEKFVFFGQEDVKDLSKDEFINGMMALNKCSDLEALFHKFDTKKDNKLTKSEVEEGLKTTDQFTDEQKEIILEELDEDADKAYTCDEFVDAVKFSKNFTALYKF